MRALILASLVAIGCGKVDPCSGHGGVCVGLRVEGSIKSLDQLAVSVDKPQSKTVSTAAQPISLPVAVALDLPAGTSGTVHIGVLGLLHGAEVATGSTAVTISGGHASATVTLTPTTVSIIPDLSMTSGGGGDMAGGGGGGDLSGGQGSLDMAGCGMITTCANADNCCPNGCNNTNDSDCPSVCGNGVVEAGEVCDDSNTTGGDGCDPTCRWREALTDVSGIAGGFGHADGPAGTTRWDSPEAMAWDGTNLYVSDQLDCTIRKLSMGALAATTIAGSAYDCSTADGTMAQSRFNFIGNHPDMAYLSGKLYVTDPASGSIRIIDLASNTVTTGPTGLDPTGIGVWNNSIYFYDATASTGGFKLYTPPTTVGNVVTAATMANYIDPGATCHHITCNPTNFDCWLACERNIVYYNVQSGAVSSLAGNSNGAGGYNLGCVSAGVTFANAKFEYAAHIATDDNGNEYVVDTSCHEIVKLVSGTSTASLFAGHAGSYGFVDGVASTSAYFNTPVGIVYKDSSNMWVADGGNGVIRQIITDSYTVSGQHHPVAEMLTAMGNTTVFTSSAVGVATDGTYAYLIDGSGRIIKVTLASGAAAVLTLSNPSAWPVTSGFRGLVFLGGVLYTTNGNGVIQSVHTDGTGAAVYAGTPNTTSPPSDGTRLSAVMNPHDLATDGTNLYFVDGGKEIRSIDAAGMVHTLAGNSTSTDYMDQTGTAAHFLRAAGLACDGKNLYTADASTAGGQGGPGPSAIRRINIATTKVDTIAGSASTNGHMDGAGASALFSGIGALTSDGLSVFVTDLDTYNTQKLHLAPVIRQLDLKTLTVSTMVGTPGQQTFATGSGTQALVHDPEDLTYDATLHALFFFDNAEYVLGRVK